jgi:multiple sugar transport system substrate-binding protein
MLATTQLERDAGAGPSPVWSRRSTLRTSIAAGAGMLAACGLGTNTSGPAPVTGPPVQVAYWGYLAETYPSRGIGVQQMTRFNAEHASQKVSINIEEARPAVDATKILAASAGGTPPDLWYGGYDDMANLYNRRAILDVEQAVKGQKDWPKMRADFFPTLLETQKWMGTLTAIPIDTNIQVPYYLRPAFTKANVTPPKAGWTWDDMLEIARKAAAPPEIFGWDYDWSGALKSLNQWRIFYSSLKGQVFNKDGTKITLNNDTARQAMQFVYDFIWKQNLVPSPTAFPKHPGELLGQSKTVFELQAAFRIPTLRQQGADFGSLPPVVAPRGGVPSTFGRGSAIALMATDHTRPTQWATYVALWCAAPAKQAEIMIRGQELPTVRSALELPEAKTYAAQDAAIKPHMDSLQYQSRDGVLPTGTLVQTTIADLLGQYMQNKIGLSEALQRMETEGQVKLDEALRL